MAQPTDPLAPIPFELFHAYPVGSLSFLAGAASVMSAEHGVDAARDLFILLASSESFWDQLRGRFEHADLSRGGGELAPASPDGTNGAAG